MSDTGGIAAAQMIELGHIGAAHGIRGEVVIKSYTEDPLAIGRYGPLTDKDGARTFRLAGLRVAGKGLIARIDGVTDRTAAEALRGTSLWCRRDQLPAAAANSEEWYVVDLFGATVEVIGSLDGLVGKVVDVANYGAGDLLEIRFEGIAETVLLPFTRDFVPEIDIASGRIGVVLPDGLMGGGNDDEPDADPRDGE